MARDSSAVLDARQHQTVIVKDEGCNAHHNPAGACMATVAGCFLLEHFPVSRDCVSCHMRIDPAVHDFLSYVQPAEDTMFLHPLFIQDSLTVGCNSMLVVEIHIMYLN